MNLTEISLFFVIIFNVFDSNHTDFELQEAHCLARNIYKEAGIESIIGQRAVAHVTINRRDLEFYPSSICDVVLHGYRYANQRGSCQFSWVCDGKSDEIVLHNGEDIYNNVVSNWTNAITVAGTVLFKDDEDPTGGATHYFNPNICFKNSVRFGNHCYPPWAINGINSGRFVKINTPYSSNGMIDRHIFLIDTYLEKVIVSQNEITDKQLAKLEPAAGRN